MTRRTTASLQPSIVINLSFLDSLTSGFLSKPPIAWRNPATVAMAGPAGVIYRRGSRSCRCVMLRHVCAAFCCRMHDMSTDLAW